MKLIAHRVMQIVAVVALFLALKHDVLGELHPGAHPLPFDFRAVYCGAYVTAHHGDPYLAAPLRACENSLEQTAQLPLPNQALPATLPPYAQILFSPIGALSEIQAQRIFFSLSFVALFAAIWAIAEVSLLPLSLVTIVLVFGLYLPAARVGSVATLGFCGLAFCAYFYQLRKWSACAASFLFIMLLPQTGIAVAVALFLKEKRLRVPLVLATLLLVLLCIPFGIVHTLEYPTALSIHGRAELYQGYQLSLAFMVRHLGAPESIALLIGTSAYIIWLISGAVYALRLRQPSDALAVAMPAALSVFPGSFEHPIYLASMLPAALIFLQRERAVSAFLAISCIAIAWQPILRPSNDLYLILSIVGAAATAVYFFEKAQSMRLIPLVVVVPLIICAGIHPTLPPNAVAPVAESTPFASQEWDTNLRAQNSLRTPVIVDKIPYYMSFVLLAFVAYRKREVSSGNASSGAVSGNRLTAT